MKKTTNEPKRSALFNPTPQKKNVFSKALAKFKGKHFVKFMMLTKGVGILEKIAFYYVIYKVVFNG